MSPALMEGCAAAKELVEGLQRAGPKPTTRSLRAAFEHIGNFDIGGLAVSDSPSNQIGLGFASLSIIDGSGGFPR